jgi:hypothetical protein
VPLANAVSSQQLVGAGAEIIFRWTGSRYATVPLTSCLWPETGYWVFSENGSNGTAATGLPSDGKLRLQTGWTLVGPSFAGGRVPQGVRSVISWDSINQAFERLGLSAPLQLYDGYWFYASEPVDIEPQE